MAKDRSFAAKMAKATQDISGKKCPVCGNLYSSVKVVAAEKSPQGAYKFKENIVGICKCNEREVYA